MARQNNSSSSLVLTVSHYASTGKSVCYSLPTGLAGMVTRNTAFYAKLGSLGGLCKAGEIPHTITLTDAGIIPLTYCKVEALPMPEKAVENFADPSVFYSAVKTALGDVQAEAKAQVKVRGRTVQDITPPAQLAPTRITGKNSEKAPLPVAADTGNTRVEALESTVASMQADVASIGANVQALLAALAGAPAKKGSKR